MVVSSRVLAVHILVTVIVFASFHRPSTQTRTQKHKPPPRVDESTLSNCTIQKMRFRHISCESDGSFSPVQCMGRSCHCIDTTTLEKLKPVEHSRRNDSNVCSEGMTCRSRKCGPRICTHGYRQDNDGCPTCMCEPPQPPLQCDTIRELQKTCHCDCVNSTQVEDRGLRHSKTCPFCEQSCNDAASGDCIEDASDCPPNTMLLIVGRVGRPECVQDLGDGDMCTVTEEPSVGPKGARARAKLKMIGRQVTSCQNGSTCVQIGIKEYRCEMEEDTPCRQERHTNENIECDRKGRFEPLQCEPIEGPTGTTTSDGQTESMRLPMQCRCVDLTTGGTLMGSERRVEPRDRMPDCRGRDCTVSGVRGRGKKGRMYRVKHGETYFDSANCRTCQCNDGNPSYYCSDMAEVCSTVNSRENCTLDGSVVIAHGEVMVLDCQVCGCSNGRVRCVKNRNCVEETVEPVDGPVGGATTEPEVVNMCDECKNLPPSPVCGPDGRNHRTQCEAVYCAGIPALDLSDGPCQSVDVCAIHPCESDSFACVPRRGVACIGISGCEANQLRTCVDFSTLRCPADNETTVEDQVCGSDNNTYPSICNLLQTTVDVQIAHNGACESEECTQYGEVCGTDGVTYPNPCVLSSTSIARLDYPSACVTVANASTAEICTKVREELNLCVVNADNCDFIVQPQSGCCPICGGSVTIAFDREALTVAASIDSQFQSVDYIISELIDIFAEISCEVEFTVNEYSDIELSLTSTESALFELCFNQTKEIAELINGGALTSEPGARRRRQTDPESEESTEVPQMYDNTMAAAIAPLISNSTTDGTATVGVTTTGAGGAPTLSVQLGAMISVLVVTLLSLLLC